MVSLPPAIVAAGRLIGLVTGKSQGDPVDVDPAWFGHPLASLERSGSRLGQLTAFLDATVGRAASAPSIPGGPAYWYPLPTPDGLATPLYVVSTAAPGAADGSIGLGACAPLRLGTVGPDDDSPDGDLLVEPYVFLPLVGYDTSTAQPLVLSPTGALQLGVSVVSSTPFVAGSVSYAGFRIAAVMPFAGGTPTLSLTFDDLKRAQRSNDTSLPDNAEVLAWIAAVLPKAAPWLNHYLGSSSLTFGDVLGAVGFLRQSPPYPHADDAKPPTYELALEQLEGQSAWQIACGFLFGALDLAAGLADPLVDLPGGGLFVEHDSQTGAYGLRVVGQVSLGDGAQASGPVVDLCLGTFLTGDSYDVNWCTRAGSPSPDPGLSLLLVRRSSDGLITFAPGFSVASAGVNLRGAAGAPLLNVSGYTLGGLELRASFGYDGAWRWGLAARIDDVGVPLGGDFADTQTGPPAGNGVVRTLMASGGGDSAGGPPAAPINPAFSADVAYVSGKHFDFELFDASGKPADMVWIPVQRRFGPMTCNKVGVGVAVTGTHLDDPVIRVGLDGGVALGPLNIELDQLTVSVHLKSAGAFSSYDLDLQGLTVSWVSGSVALSGGLVKVTHTDHTVSYDGEALLKAQNLALSAVGSFGSLPDGTTSLFVFAMLDAPIGGPPFFYVTGLAAGFGYNRALRIPTQNQVQDFPLVAGVTNPRLLGAKPTRDPKSPVPTPDPASALGAMEAWMPPERGEYWLAAGVQFTTFEVVHTNALLLVEFGHDLVVAVVGIATLKQPLEGTPWVYAELDVEVVFRPREGELLATAVLAPGSYVLTEAAHLTGGFAFAAWFGAKHAGDFVLTLGGYHPAFQAPSHYPQEPRVGIDWKVGSEIVLVGGVYFAMTPAVMMAGGALQVTFEAGPLKAWLKASVDLIMFWHPFFLDARASISVGVSFHIQVLSVDVTLSVEIGVEFEVWGPPTGFRAHVDWYVVSFTIGEGEKKPPEAIGWEEFKQLLPVKTRVASPPTETPAYVTISATSGLLRASIAEGASHWLVRAREFAFAANCAFPPTSVTVQVPSKQQPEPLTQMEKIAIRPVGMQAAEYDAPHTITIVKLNRQHPDPGPDVAAVDWTVTRNDSGVPQALWGAPVDGTTPPANPNGPTVKALVGATVEPTQSLPTTCTPEMQIDVVFADRVVSTRTDTLPIGPADRPTGAAPVQADSFADIANVATKPVAAKRTALFMALAGLGVDAGGDEPMATMGASPGDSFAGEPLEGTPA